MSPSCPSPAPTPRVQRLPHDRRAARQLVDRHALRPRRRRDHRCQQHPAAPDASRASLSTRQATSSAARSAGCRRCRLRLRQLSQRVRLDWTCKRPPRHPLDDERDEGAAQGMAQSPAVLVGALVNADRRRRGRSSPRREARRLDAALVCSGLEAGQAPSAWRTSSSPARWSRRQSRQTRQGIAAN